MADRQFLEQLSRKLADEGRLIEAGWVALRLQTIPLNAPAVQLQEMRIAYMAGAQHLFASMMGMLEEGVMETENDMRRMDLIAKELEVFTEELKLRVSKPADSG